MEYSLIATLLQWYLIAYWTDKGSTHFTIIQTWKTKDQNIHVFEYYWSEYYSYLLNKLLDIKLSVAIVNQKQTCMWPCYEYSAW